jgi:hypothetical protein
MLSRGESAGNAAIAGFTGSRFANDLGAEGHPEVASHPRTRAPAHPRTRAPAHSRTRALAHSRIGAPASFQRYRPIAPSVIAVTRTNALAGFTGSTILRRSASRRPRRAGAGRSGKTRLAA